MAANIRVFCETTKFLEEFLILALISHRFGFTSHWSVGPVDKSPFGRRFSIHGFAQILSLQQRFSLSFAAIDISLHANYALILLNTNCTNYTNMLLSLEKFGRFGRFVFKNQYSTLFFKSLTDLTDLTDFKLLPSSLCLDMNRKLQEVEHL